MFYENDDSLTIGVKRKSFFEKLSNGDFGLTKTFWLYGVLICLLLKLLLVPTIFMSFGLFVIGIILISAYHLILSMGVWQASNKYQGPILWPISAKVIVILFVFVTVVEIINIFKMLLNF